MSTQLPFQSRPRNPDLHPFPTRGVADGWRDPWDADPLEAMLGALRQQRALRRHMREGGVQLELVAHARGNGRWEAYVVAGEPAVLWPSTNGPTATVALDALEAELREVLHDASALNGEPPAN